MNKVLVFTYAEGWNDLSVLFMSKFDDKEWDDRYQTIENDFVFKPMAYTLYHLWQKWDAKEHSRTSNT